MLTEVTTVNTIVVEDALFAILSTHVSKLVPNIIVEIDPRAP